MQGAPLRPAGAGRLPDPDPARAQGPRPTPPALTFCSSAEAASGTSADIVLPLQTRRREKMRLAGGRGHPAASRLRPARRPAQLFQRPPGHLRPQKWPPPYDDTEPRSAPRAKALARRSPPAPPAPRPYLLDPASPARCRPNTSFFPSKVAAPASPHIRLWLPNASWEL